MSIQLIKGWVRNLLAHPPSPKPIIEVYLERSRKVGLGGGSDLLVRSQAMVAWG